MTVMEPRLINPWKQWHGAFVPEWLCRRTEVSAGAKLAYARLCRFAGKEGVARPELVDLAEELGVEERQARRYTKELAAHDLVKITRRGLGQPNLYEFPEHPWMGFDGADTSDPSRADTYDRSGTDTSRLSGTDASDRSTPDASDRQERTHTTAQDRTDVSAPSSLLPESEVQSQTQADAHVGEETIESRTEYRTLWATFVEILGHEPVTTVEKGVWRRAVNDLKQIGATADELRHRAVTFQQRFPGAVMTETAIVRRWGELGAQVPQPATPTITAPRMFDDPPRCATCNDSGHVPSEPGDPERRARRCPDCTTRTAVAS